MDRVKAWLRLTTNPVVVVYVLAIVLLVTNLYIAQYTRPYTSDDVSWQNILRTWVPLGGHRVDMGMKDNFLVNVPALAVFAHLFSPTRTLLFVEASIFAFVNFTLFYVASLYFLKKCNIKVSYTTVFPFVWIASLGYNFAQLFLNTDWRDFEMGISFVYFVLAVKIYYGELNPFRSWVTKLATLLIIGIAGIFAYSDPYFLYLTILPIALLFTVFWAIKKAPREQAFLGMGGLVFAVIVVRAMKSLVARAGLFTPHGSTLSVVPLNRLVGETATSLNELTTIFGANTSGDHLASVPALTALLNLALVLIITAWLVIVAARFYNNREQLGSARYSKLQPITLLTVFFGALYVLVFAANVVDVEDDYRYFVLSIYLIGILAAFYIGVMRRSNKFFVAVVGLTICANIVTSVFANTPMQAVDAANNKANAANYTLIHKLEQLGLTKGYGDYWDGNINSYLSNGRVTILPVTCSDSAMTEPLYLLVDTSQFTQPASRSFYVFDPTIVSNPPVCTEQQVLAQFGTPAQTVHVAGKDILIYDHDLASSMKVN